MDQGSEYSRMERWQTENRCEGLERCDLFLYNRLLISSEKKESAEQSA